MKLFSVICAALLLAGCPTPPETVSNNNAPGAATPGPGPGPGAAAPGNPSAPAPDAGKAGKMGKAGGDAPPDGAEPPADGGEAPPDGGGEAPAGGSDGGGGKVATNGMIIEIQQNITDKLPEPTQSQDELKEGDHVTYSGQLSCSTYSGAIIISVGLAPGEEVEEGEDIVANIKLTQPGAFEFVLPKSEKLMVMEILGDANSDGGATIGERAAIYMLTGDMGPNKDRTGLDLKLSM